MKSESDDQEQTVRLYRTGEHSCSYLKGQQARTLFLDPELTFNRDLYEQLTHMGFRRSGMHLYKPDCKRCDACMPSRVRVTEFEWKRRFRRVLKKNADLSMHRVPCRFSMEQYKLYEHYIATRHSDGDMYPPSVDSFRDFLLSRPDLGFILEFRREGELLAVAFTDRLESGLSATYTFFRTDCADRSLGTFAILKQIELCRALYLPYLYLGYWVPGSPQMTYKSNFQPLDILINRRWQGMENVVIDSVTLNT